MEVALRRKQIPHDRNNRKDEDVIVVRLIAPPTF
jgi:hypothetical protein